MSMSRHRSGRRHTDASSGSSDLTMDRSPT